jgi:preprotein translocase subunit SecF
MINKINFSSKFKLCFSISSILFFISIGLIFFKGLNLGVDFKGGTVIEIRLANTNVTIGDLRDKFDKNTYGDVSIKEFGNTQGDFLVKIEKFENDNNQIEEIKLNLSQLDPDINFRRVESVGPKVSEELLQTGILAIAISLGAMLFYIWMRFEWQFSLGSITALFHDVIITLGIFSLFAIEMNLSIVAAILTIVGYSMNDTVVIYDRIRENLIKYSKLNISETSDLSINETLSRTLITSITTLLALLSIFILGGEILRGFSFALILGVVIGTYSSIFIASPVLKFLKVSHRTMLKETDDKIVP